LGDDLNPDLEKLLAGPTAIAFAREDIVTTTKSLMDYFRELRRPEITVKGGFVEGKVYSPDQVTALSKIPPRPIVLGQAVGTLQAPLSNFVGTMNGILSEFARTLQALSEKRQGEAGSP
jgi:large subunit ribosomal protein L10